MYVYNVHSQKIANHSHILSLTRTQVIASVAELQLLVPRPAGVNVNIRACSAWLTNRPVMADATLIYFHNVQYSQTMPF